MTVESLSMSTVKLLADQVELFIRSQIAIDCHVNEEALRFIVENVKMN